ncbi:hypothetical protein [Methylobacterium variabile]|jgi:hypothetical protein|uniref:hypothetical protein n=1 Tax=Methylobacterium variabile TaxID=298794 RepID=UPI000AA53D0C|nr:hypothetical protein [Methylobacterium variabile]
MQVFLIALGLVVVLVAVGVFGRHPDHRAVPAPRRRASDPAQRGATTADLSR